MPSHRILLQYREMSAADRHSFDRWLEANAVFAAIMAVAFSAMAVSQSKSLGPTAALAEDSRPAPAFPAAPLSLFQIMSRLPSGRLPVQQVNEPF